MPGPSPRLSAAIHMPVISAYACGTLAPFRCSEARSLVGVKNAEMIGPPPRYRGGGPQTGQRLLESCRAQLRLIAWCAGPVPIPVTGTTTPDVLEALVASAGVATASGALGAYIASLNVVAVGCWRPTEKIVATFPAENELEM